MESSVIETAVASCIHCGTAFRVTPHRPDFCCAGCEFVHLLITRNGLGQFYDLRDGETPPVKPLVFQQRDYAWLEDLVREAGTNADATLTLELQGISCIGCVWLVERLWQRKPGALTIRADATLGRLQLRWQPGVLDVVEFARELQSFGYLVGPARDARPPSRALALRIGLCGAFALNTMLFTLPGYLGMEAGFELAPLFDKLTLLFSTLSLVVGGSYFAGRSWRSLRAGVLHIDLPISLGVAAAYAGSLAAWHIGDPSFLYFDFVSVFVFLMLAGRWVQQRSIERNRHRLLGLQAEPPAVERDGARQSASTLAPGLRYILRSGQHVPVRSKLLSPAGVFGMDWINGESDAHDARAGQLVPSGAIHLGIAAIELEATESWADSTLARLIAIPPPGAMSAACGELERFIRFYILAVIGIALLASAGWLAAGATLPFAMQVLVSILVVSCPCALGVALPMADELAASTLRRAGLFVRDATLWARLARVRRVVFDKTGTLTLETMALRNPETLDALPPDTQRILARMLLDNLHPVSCALREHLMARGVEPWNGPLALDETVGAGVSGKTPDAEWRLGRPGWAGPATEPADCILSRNGGIVTSFDIAEEIRSDAPEEIAALQRLGLAVHILSGDRAPKVAAIAGRLRLPSSQCHAGMSPEDKAQWLRITGDALMIGDGANDSLAFNESLCRGTPAIDRALLAQKADFYFLGRGLAAIRRLFEVATHRRASVRAVTAFALCYNTLAIALCVAGRMSPLAAAVLMPISSLVSLAIVFTRRTDAKSE